MFLFHSNIVDFFCPSQLEGIFFWYGLGAVTHSISNKLLPSRLHDLALLCALLEVRLGSKTTNHNPRPNKGNLGNSFAAYLPYNKPSLTPIA